MGGEGLGLGMLGLWRMEEIERKECGAGCLDALYPRLR